MFYPVKFDARGFCARWYCRGTARKTGYFGDVFAVNSCGEKEHEILSRLNGNKCFGLFSFYKEYNSLYYPD